MIDILLAVYNGERYLAEQLDSILAQTVADWRLLAQDDGSTDQSFAILQSYAARYPGKILARQNRPGSGSAQNNFYSLLRQSSAPYVMACDQDDVWLPDKIERTLACMQRLEREHGPETPLLVHTDLTVVDENLQPVHPSLMRLQDLDPRRCHFAQLLVQNIVTGCTMMVNRPLLGYLQELPRQSIMHDWWLALLAAAFGQIGFLPEPTILYRQHGANQVGAKDVRSLSYNWRRFRDRLQAKGALRDTYLQAAEFCRLYGGRLPPRQREVALAYSTIARQHKLRRIQILLQYRLLKNNPVRQLAQLLFV